MRVKRLKTYLSFLFLCTILLFSSCTQSGKFSGSKEINSERNSSESNAGGNGQGYGGGNGQGYGGIINRTNSFLKCDLFSKENSRLANLECAAWVKYDNGVEIKATSLQAGITLTWHAPVFLTQVPVTVKSCTTSHDSLNYSCLLEAQDTSVLKPSVSFTLEEATEKTVKTAIATTVQLPAPTPHPTPKFDPIETPFISTWKTDNPGTSQNNQIVLPLEPSGTYQFNVDWGDGSSSDVASYNDPNATHTYATPGTYTISIKGVFVGIRVQNGHQLKLLNISQWGALRFGNSREYFSGAKNMTITATDIPDLSATTDLSYAFSFCSSLTDIPNINNWNISHVTNLESMFQGSGQFNSPIGNWDTANVTNMSHMFFAASAFNQNIGNWNTTNVTDMSHMFFAASAFNQNIGNWNTSNVTTMHSMFYEATVFNQDIGNWNTANVTTMAKMFLNASAFNQNIGNWDVRKVVSMNTMFSSSGITQANYDNTLAGWNSRTGPYQSSVLVNYPWLTSSASPAAQAAINNFTTQYSWSFLP